MEGSIASEIFESHVLPRTQAAFLRQHSEAEDIVSYVSEKLFLSPSSPSCPEQGP